MCVLLIDLRPDSAPLPGASRPALSASQRRTLLLAEGMGGASAVTVCFAGGAVAYACEERGLPFEALRDGTSGVGLYLALRRLVRRLSARVVHLLGFEALVQAAWLRRSGTFRLALTLEGRLPALARSRMKALRMVDAFLTPSSLLAEELKARAASGAIWLAPRGKKKGVGTPPLIRSILPATLPVGEISRTRPAPFPFALPPGHPARQGRALDQNPRHFVFLAVSGSGPGSGLPTLFSAMARLRVLAEPLPWEVHVVGALPDFAALLAEAEELRTADRLALLGAQDVDSAMAICDAVISPVEDDRGQVDTLLAAWAHALPVIASSLPRHEELDPEGRAFSRFTPSTPVDLADAMLELMRDGACCERLVAGGASVVERLSPEHFCAAHKTVYEDLIGEQPVAAEA